MQAQTKNILLDQINQEIQNGAYFQQNFANDGERFVAWYLRRVLCRDAVATRDDITDGAGDKQIDAVVVDDEESRVIIIQGKFISASQVDGEPLREVLAAWVRLQDLPALQRDCNEKLKVKLEAVRKALEEDYRIDFELITTGVLTDAAKADLQAYSDKLEESDFASGKVFSPQNWLKANTSVQGENLVAGTIAGMLSGFPNGKAMLELLKAPPQAFGARWSAE